MLELSCLPIPLHLLPNLLSLQRRLNTTLDLDPRVWRMRRLLRTLTFDIPNLVPHEHHHGMSGRDAALLGAPTELPEGGLLLLLGFVFGVVEAGDVAEAEEGVVEAALWWTSVCKYLKRDGCRTWV